MSAQDQPLIVSVIIPFFQRESGLLLKCVESIRQQEGPFKLEVVVVDDSSPIAASAELAAVLAEDNRIRVLQQDNAGPGAARNKGLDNVSAESQYIAFIDSDDWWQPGFLQCAIAALERGFDIFFCDSQRIGFTDSRFQWQQQQELNLLGTAHHCLDTTMQIYAYQGDFFDYAIVRSNIISTSALVYRRAIAKHLRFSTKLFNGQDRLFKLQLAQISTAVVFSDRVLVQEGTGINIFDSAKWGTAKSVVLLCNYLKLNKAILRELTLNRVQKQRIKHKLNQTRYSLVASMLHLLKARESFNWKLIGSASKADLAFVLLFLPNVVRVILGKKPKP